MKLVITSNVVEAQHTLDENCQALHTFRLLTCPKGSVSPNVKVGILSNTPVMNLHSSFHLQKICPPREICSYLSRFSYFRSSYPSMSAWLLQSLKYINKPTTLAPVN